MHLRVYSCIDKLKLTKCFVDIVLTNVWHFLTFGATYFGIKRYVNSYKLSRHYFGHQNVPLNKRKFKLYKFYHFLNCSCLFMGRKQNIYWSLRSKEKKLTLIKHYRLFKYNHYKCIIAITLNHSSVLLNLNSLLGTK